MIVSEYVTYRNDTLTKLARPLNDGDTVVYLEDLENFELTDKIYRNGFIFWDYQDSTGYLYPPETYSRHVKQDVFESSGIDKENNTITLKEPWDHGNIEVGTKLS